MRVSTAVVPIGRSRCVVLQLAAALLCACSPMPRATVEPKPVAAPTVATAVVTTPSATDLETVDALPVPTMAACTNKVPPQLPAAWQTGAILQHFADGELVIGNLVYDGAASALRFSLIGMTGGSADYLLASGGNLFSLSGGYPTPTKCELVAKTSLAVPSRSWNNADSTCVGEAQVDDANMVWWKHKVPEISPQPSGANWLWYHADNPSNMFRSMFQKPTNDFGIVGHFALSYFPQFHEVTATGVSSLVNLCKRATKPTNPHFDPGSVAALLAPNSIPLAQQPGLLGTWVPGLQKTDPATPPPWPNQVGATALMVSVNYCYAPLPTRVYYDWTLASQNTTMFWNQEAAVPAECAGDEFFATKALLYGTKSSPPSETGYAIPENVGIGPIACVQALPGMPRPNWMKFGGCTAKAAIAPGTTLNHRSEPLKIVHCPITPPNVVPAMAFWAWYFDSGTPLAFMQTNATTGGTGLNLADYFQWKPGAVARPNTYDLPALCDRRPKKKDEPGCHKCHMPTAQE